MHLDFTLFAKKFLNCDEIAVWRCAKAMKAKMLPTPLRKARLEKYFLNMRQPHRLLSWLQLIGTINDNDSLQEFPELAFFLPNPILLILYQLRFKSAIGESLEPQHCYARQFQLLGLHWGELRAAWKCSPDSIWKEVIIRSVLQYGKGVTDSLCQWRLTRTHIHVPVFHDTAKKLMEIPKCVIAMVVSVLWNLGTKENNDPKLAQNTWASRWLSSLSLSVLRLMQQV